MPFDFGFQSTDFVIGLIEESILFAKRGTKVVLVGLLFL